MVQSNATFERPRAGRQSGLRARVQHEPAAQSTRLWGLDWTAILPWVVEGGVIEFATPEDALPFVAEHYPSIFGTAEFEGRFLSSPMTAAKQRFFQQMDYFVVRIGGELGGVVMGHPLDWTTYYVRSAALLPRFRDRHILSSFAERLYPPLAAAGVERVECESSPANVAMARVMSAQGFMVTASVSSERWGLMLRYTKFLSEEARAVFFRQYTATTFAKKDSHPTPSPPRRTP